MFIQTTKLFINGQFVESKTKNWIDLYNPVCIKLSAISFRMCHIFAKHILTMHIKTLLFYLLQATNELLTKVPETTQEEMQAATKSASEAFKTWSQTTLLHRQQLIFRLAELIRRDLVFDLF